MEISILVNRFLFCSLNAEDKNPSLSNQHEIFFSLHYLRKLAIASIFLSDTDYNVS